MLLPALCVAAWAAPEAAAGDDYWAKREAAREERRLLEAKERAKRNSEERAQRRLRRLEEKLEEGKRDAPERSGARSRFSAWGHGSNDGQAGGHCMYGADGNLIYAPDGARCAAHEDGSGAPAAVAPGKTQGCVAGNCRDGHGTWVWSDGTRYVGGFQGGLQHGQGSLAFANGASYVGAPGSDRASGLAIGTAIFADGRVQGGALEGRIAYLGQK